MTNRKCANGKTILYSIGRAVMLRAQGGLCAVCGEPLKPGHTGDARITVEHVWPVACTAGLRTSVGNVCLSHEGCNLWKDNRPPTACERLMLFCVNRALALPEHETRRLDV